MKFPTHELELYCCYLPGMAGIFFIRKDTPPYLYKMTMYYIDKKMARQQMAGGYIDIGGHLHSSIVQG